MDNRSIVKKNMMRKIWNIKSGIVCDNNKLIATLGRELEIELEIELVVVLVMISILNLKMGNI